MSAGAKPSAIGQGAFRGDVREMAAGLLVVTRDPDKTGLSAVGLGYLSALGGRVPVLPLDITEPTQTQQIVEMARFCSAVIVTESPASRPRLLQQLREVEGKLRRVLILPWDSDVLPDEEAKVINDCFDVVIPISEDLGDSWRRQLPNLEFCYLPIPLELRALIALAAVRQNIPSRSGRIELLSIASYHRRKNHHQVIRAVARLRELGWDIHLRIHSSLDQGEFEGAKAYARRLLGKHAKITHGPKPKRELHDLYASADAFISLSHGEGYNIPAREALASGLPTLVSGIPGHADLIGLPGVTTVPCPIPIPAGYPERSSVAHGVQHMATDEAAAQALENLLTELTSGSGPSPSEISEGAWQWDVQAVRDRLWDRFAELGVIRPAPRFRPRRTASSGNGSTLVIPANDAGFFSLFNTYVSHVAYWQSPRLFGRVFADWSVYGLMNAYPAKQYTSFCYAAPEEGNAFFRLFRNLYTADGIDAETKLSQLQDSHTIIESYNVGCDPYLTYKHAEKLYRSLGFAAWRRRMNAVVCENLHLEDDLERDLAGVVSRLRADVPILGTHVRHPSHAMEQRDRTMADVADYIRCAAGWLASDVVGGDGQIILATDQQSVVNEFRAEFGDLVVVRDDVRRTSEDDSAKEALLSEAEKLTEGRQIQHLLAADTSNWTSRNAAEVIVDAWSLAKATTFVHTNSNVATAVAMVNPTSTMLHIRPYDSWETLLTRHELSRILPIT